MNGMALNLSELCLVVICLVASTVGLETIIGGEKSQENGFRYQVSVQTHGHAHACGGSIIGEQFILSAAHCFVTGDGRFHGRQLYVLTGTNNLHHTGPPAVMIQVSKIFIPSEFDLTDIRASADLAVLKLREALPLARNRHLLRIKLPKNKRELYDGAKAIISGFGWDRVRIVNGTEYGENSDGTLLFANVDVISPGQPGYPLGKIYQKHICARVKQHEAQQRGVCIGDSGGPLVYDNVLIGVLSKSPKGCSERDFAATYTRVSNYLTFIRNAMKDKITRNIRVFP